MKPSTNPEPFFPSPQDLPDGFPQDLSFATRTVYIFKPDGLTQYLVFEKGYNATNDPRLNHVVGSGDSLAIACASAERIIALNAKKPSDFWPRLQGCTFAKLVEPNNTALQHVCMDANGQELSRADTREESARLALHQALIGCNDVTFEEFCAISVVAKIQSSGARTYGFVFADDDGLSAVRRLLSNAYKNNESTRQAAAAELQKHELLPGVPGRAQSAALTKKRVQAKDASPLSAKEQWRKRTFDCLCQVINKTLLSAPNKSAALHTHVFSPEDGKWVANIVLHTSALTARQALTLAFEDDKQMRQERAQQIAGSDIELQPSRMRM